MLHVLREGAAGLVEIDLHELLVDRGRGAVLEDIGGRVVLLRMLLGLVMSECGIGEELTIDTS